MSVTARVRVTIEIPAPHSNWDNKATFGEVFEAARKETVRHLEQVLLTARIPIKVIGEPIITAIYYTEEGKHSNG